MTTRQAEHLLTTSYAWDQRIKRYDVYTTTTKGVFISSTGFIENDGELNMDMLTTCFDAERTNRPNLRARERNEAIAEYDVQ